MLDFNQLTPDEQRIYKALQSVIDPEIGENLIDLGLVYGIKLQNGIATVTFTMTSYACPMSEMVMDSMHAAVSKVLGNGVEPDLHLVWEPAWGPDMIVPEAKKRLGWD